MRHEKGITQTNENRREPKAPAAQNLNGLQ
jgi:hypothetical protein